MEFGQFVVEATPASLEESERLQNLSESQVAEDYLRNPPLPVNQEITIDKLGILNFNLITKEHNGLLRYGALRIKRPDLFPEAKDPEFDYTDEEQVSPVIVISGDKKYRTDQLLWFPLSDAIAGITMRQGVIRKKLLPIKVMIDEKNQWVARLLNLAKMGKSQLLNLVNKWVGLRKFVFHYPLQTGVQVYGFVSFISSILIADVLLSKVIDQQMCAEWRTVHTQIAHMTSHLNFYGNAHHKTDLLSSIQSQVQIQLQCLSTKHNILPQACQAFISALLLCFVISIPVLGWCP
ncbi:uncharacterized protein LOC128986003 isoform X2 [Macrosteles quadrilineatus]|uniref:uncharacterized protein LOC128986003 isoform X2 n=1 Tax=Macrosteles quadrilineatus TaxID=74068 RepID=UPI0023E2EE7C|nr:uncharacterized protein LOC128986003 isoform X2 [Macrosteles quadrilineatus]